MKKKLLSLFLALTLALSLACLLYTSPAYTPFTPSKSG